MNAAPLPPEPLRFLVDAQLPRRPIPLLEAAGYQAPHTLDLPLANRTADHELVEIATTDKWVLVSKDADFVVSRLLHQQPAWLLRIAAGNCPNRVLLDIFRRSLPAIANAFRSHPFV